ncbi:DUF6612 family protein [Paenibacillus cisolokensis]|uniref:DUF6612 family protein n=1 Tax=Paenibacillus cisolokensis TaxID=1658519 RepID=UPI003D2D8AAD
MPHKAKKVKIRAVRLLAVAALLAAAVALAAACSNERQESPASGDKSGGSHTEAAVRAGDAKEWLDKAAASFKGVDVFGIDMKLDQRLTTDGQTSELVIANEGNVSIEPLVMRQTVESTFDGQTDKLAAYLTPDGYFTQDLVTGEWSRMDESELPKIKASMSDYQIAPADQMKRLARHAAAFSATKDDEGNVVLAYEGDGAGEDARALLIDVLTVTLGGGALPEGVEDSIETETMSYRIVLDPDTARPVTVDVTADLTLEFEPGHPSKLTQTMSVRYDDWGEPFEADVPDEAKRAPEVIIPDAETMEELEKLLEE